MYTPTDWHTLQYVHTLTTFICTYVQGFLNVISSSLDLNGYLSVYLNRFMEINNLYCIIYALGGEEMPLCHISQIPKHPLPTDCNEWKEKKEPIGYTNISACKRKKCCLFFIYVVWACSSADNGKVAVYSVNMCLCWYLLCVYAVYGMCISMLKMRQELCRYHHYNHDTVLLYEKRNSCHSYKFTLSLKPTYQKKSAAVCKSENLTK